MSTEYVSGNSTKVFKSGKIIKAQMYNKKITLNTEETKIIQDYWMQRLEKSNTLFNGNVLTINKIENYEDSLCLHLYHTDYAHLTYIMNHPKKNITPCRSLAAGGLFVTNDNYIILGQMGKKTSFPGIIQCIGGGISQEDINDNEAPLNTVIRECYEEIGVKLNKDSGICPEKYIYIRDKMTTLGFCYVVHLDLCKDEVNNIFVNSKEIDYEISKMIFLKNDINEIEQFCKDNMLVDYLKDVLYDYSGINKVMELNDLVL